jgi:hypothetical protein
MFLLVLLISLAPVAVAPVLVSPPSDGPLFEQACQCNRARYCPDPTYMASILAYEKAVGLPPSLRGITLAAMCSESGYSTKARGDHRFHPKGKAKAYGLLQMWPWWERKYGDIRSTKHEAPKRFLEAVAEDLPTVQRVCGLKGHDAWAVSWVRLTRGRVGKCLNRHRAAGTLTADQVKRCHRCYEGTHGSHYKRWRRWQRTIARSGG